MILPLPRLSGERTRLGALALLALITCTLGACNQAPRGDAGKTIDPYERTKADRLDPSADAVTLIEFSDQVSQSLAARIASIPEIRDSQQKVVIELGDLQNNTRTPKSDFATIQRRIFINMTNSDVLREHADVVESVGRMDREAGSVAPAATVDPTGRTVTTAPSSDRYDLKITYFLQGTFNEISRVGNVQQTYNFDFTLVNAASRRIVFADQITPKQVR
ncbi:MAG: hypothetical protein AB7K52_11540 [Phycisphaerales bacterium]